jgi:arylsulfatase A-like enzyme
MLVLAVVLAGCGAPPPERVAGANVVLIGIDTLRADHLGCYGYRRPTSPRLDALARQAVLFETAVTQSPWTLPAFASIFTGLLPSSHRAGEGKQLNVSRLDPARETLATILHRAGYRTGSFVSNGYVGRDVGMAEGFDEHREAMQAAGAAAQAVGWLEAHGAERFFVFLHIVDPHQPYAPPAEHAAPFLDPAYTGPIGTSFSGFAQPGWDDADRRRVIDLYDGEVHFADSLVGRVVDTLTTLGVLDRTLVVVTSDHGEGSSSIG